MLDEFADAEQGSERVMLTGASHFDQDVVGFQNASFTWSNDDAKGTLTPSRRRFTLRVHGELLFKRGCFNLIIGPTGSGKTSFDGATRRDAFHPDEPRLMVSSSEGGRR